MDEITFKTKWKGEDGATRVLVLAGDPTEAKITRIIYSGKAKDFKRGKNERVSVS